LWDCQRFLHLYSEVELLGVLFTVCFYEIACIPPRGVGVTGAILANQVRTLDWIVRKADFLSKSTDDILCEVLGRIEAILALDCD
jgi:hypothetical protein